MSNWGEVPSTGFHESAQAATGQCQHTMARLIFLKHHLNQAPLKFRNLPRPLLPTVAIASMVCPFFSIINTMQGHLIEDSLDI